MTGILASIRFFSARIDALHLRTSHRISSRYGSTQSLSSSTIKNYFQLDQALRSDDWESTSPLRVSARLSSIA